MLAMRDWSRLQLARGRNLTACSGHVRDIPTGGCSRSPPTFASSSTVIITATQSRQHLYAMLASLDERSATIVAVAAFAGLRRCEIQGLRWSDYDGSAFRVRRLVWEGILDETKTDASNAAVPVINALAKRLDKYRASLLVTPEADAPIFAASNGRPLRLNNVLRSHILPVLKAAELEFHGWHAFRRGLATNLHSLGIDDHTIKAILRHSSVTVTQRSYIKSLPQHSVAATKAFDTSIAVLVHKRDMNSADEEPRLIN
jgi:integrase